MPATPTPPSPTNNDAALIGGIVGGVVALLLIVALIAFIMSRSRNRNRSPKARNDGQELQSAPAQSVGEYGRIELPPSQQSEYDDMRDVNLSEHHYDDVHDKL